MTIFNTTYLTKSEGRKKYKKQEIDQIFFDNPLLKNINFDHGYIDLYWSKHKYGGGWRLSFGHSKLRSSESNYLVLLHFCKGFTDYKFDYDKYVFFAKIKDFFVIDKYEDCVHELNDVNVFIKFNPICKRKINNLKKLDF